MEALVEMFGGAATLIAVLGGATATIVFAWVGIQWMMASRASETGSPLRSVSSSGALLDITGPMVGTESRSGPVCFLKSPPGAEAQVVRPAGNGFAGQDTASTRDVCRLASLGYGLQVGPVVQQGCGQGVRQPVLP